MRIAYVINSVEGGGAAFPVPTIATALKQHGAELHIVALTRRDGRAIAAIERAGFPVTVREGAEKDHVAAYRWLRKCLSAMRPDIVWTSLTRATLLGQMAGRALDIPVVSWQHAAFLRPANRRLLRLMNNRSALWIADSETVADFSRQAIGVGDDKLIVWPIFAANPKARQAKPWQPGEPVRIGTLGRLHRVKGYDVLLAALRAIQEAGALRHPFQVSIGGTGAEHAQLAETIRKDGLDSAQLAGFVDKPEDFLADQHLYVQPSRSEGFCVAAHEAMQAGLPVIGSAVGEMARSIVPATTGALVHPDDPLALAAAITGCVNQAERLSDMGARGRERLLQRYGPDRFNAIAGDIVQRLGGLCRANRYPCPLSNDRSA